MICNKDILFIHVPKTAGMAISQVLLEVLPKPVYYSVSSPSNEEYKHNNVTVIPGKRHEFLQEAKELVNQLGMDLKNFKKIIAVVRNPYDMEVSRYFYLRLGHAWDRGSAQRMAFDGNFENFAIKSLYHGRKASEIYRFFVLDGAIPSNMKILRYENLQADFESTLRDVGIETAKSLPIVNKTKHGHYRDYLTPAAEDAIYKRYKWLFDAGFYQREYKLMANHFKMGNQFIEKGKLEDAISSYRLAIAQNPNFSWYYHNLAEALVKQGRFNEAISCYRSAIAQNPNFSWFHHNLAEALVKQGQLDEAIAAYRRAIEIKPNCHQSREKLESALTKQRQLISDRSFQLLDSYWRAFHNLDLKVLSGLTYDSLACAIASPDLKDRFRSRFSQLDKNDIEEIANLFNSHGLEFSKTRYDEFIKFVTKPDFPINIIGQAFTSGGANIPSPFSSNDAISSLSILTEREANFILFRDDRHCFYIVQYCCQVAVIFPQMYCAIHIHNIPAWFDYIMKKLHQLPECLIRHFDVILSNSFKPYTYSGLFVGKSRPYHYFADYMYGFQLAYKQGLVNESTHVYAMNGGDFIPISNFYKLKQKEYTGTYQDINDKLFTERKFIISSSLPYVYYKNPSILSDLDSHLVQTTWLVSPTSEPEMLDNLLASAKECFPLVWIGVAGEKRSWKELGEGIPKIINLIHQSFPNVGVVFDGRTFPLTPSPGDYHHLKMDNERVKQIEERLDADIRTFNIIGKTAPEKLRWASLIDFFITHYATDSMYVSRMCKKPGVVHFPKSIGVHRRMHLHHNVFEIPEEAITDYPDPNNPDVWHCASYSIPWEIVYEQVLKLWESMPMSKLRALPSYLESPDF